MATETNDLRDRPIGEIAGALTRDLSLLVRQELQLARAEMSDKAKQTAAGVGMMAAAAGVALCAAGALTAAIVLALAEAVDPWLAALITTALLALVAAGFALMGKRRVEEVGPPVPEETIENVKEDAQWVKEQAQSGRR
jgi:hypothetical protein